MYFYHVVLLLHPPQARDHNRNSTCSTRSRSTGFNRNLEISKKHLLAGFRKLERRWDASASNRDGLQATTLLPQPFQNHRLQHHQWSQQHNPPNQAERSFSSAGSREGLQALDLSPVVQDIFLWLLQYSKRRMTICLMSQVVATAAHISQPLAPCK